MLLFEYFSNLYIDPPEAGNISLSTCSPGVNEVSTTISEIANIGSPTPNVACSAQGVTVENGIIRVSCDGRVNGTTIVCIATNPLGSEVFYLLFFQGTFVTAVMQEASS